MIAIENYWWSQVICIKILSTCQPFINTMLTKSVKSISHKNNIVLIAEILLSSSKTFLTFYKILKLFVRNLIFFSVFLTFKQIYFKSLLVKHLFMLF